MPRKTKKRHPLQGLLRSSGITVAAIVMLCVSLGALMVPGIFAETGVPSISGVQATPGGGRNYGVTVTWDGWTRDHWKGETYRAGTLVSQWTSNSQQYSVTGLTCGVQYTFKVAAAGPNGGAQSDWKSDAAVPTCPTAQWISYGRVGNRVDMQWRDGSGFSERYVVLVSVNGGGFTAYTTTTATSYSFTGNCGTAYATKLVANANGQNGPETSTQSIATGACPPQTPTGGGSSGGTTPGGGSPSGGSSGGSLPTTTSSSSSGGKRLPATSQGATKVLAPSAPENFAAEVVSSKIVLLSWDAATKADHYVISRSTDNTTWEEIANTTQTSYKDEGANFSTTYYYQLQAVGVDGQRSSAVAAQVTTEAFKGSSNTITSEDKLVTATIPDGTIEGEYSCTISTTDTQDSQLPKGQSLVLGPYDLLCVTEAGDVVVDFEKGVPVTMKLSSISGNYKNVTARTLKNGTWQITKSKYDTQKRQLSFTLTKATSFATFGEKQKNIWGTIGTILLILLLIAAAVLGLLWWRRRMPIERNLAAQTEVSAEKEFQQALAQPDCSHLSMAQQVIPSSSGCTECEQQHTHWNALRICLICGHVGCSDDSPQQHAFKHFQETGHPLIYEFGNPNGNTIGWCYIDQTYI